MEDTEISIPGETSLSGSLKLGLAGADFTGGDFISIVTVKGPAFPSGDSGHSRVSLGPGRDLETRAE